MPLKANDYHNHLKLKTKAQICYFLLFLSVFFEKIRWFADDFLRKSLVYSHSGSIHVLGRLLLVLAYFVDDGDGGRCPILLDVHVVVLIALY